jgi:hypothetical protein
LVAIHEAAELSNSIYDFNSKMKLALKYLLIISGLIPALYLLGLTLIFLPGIVKDFDYSLVETIIIMSMLFGVLGFLGLVFSVLPRFENRPRLKFILLTAGVIGSFVFTTVAGGKKAWMWIFYIEEFDEWIIWAWPVIVSIILLVLNGREMFDSNPK